MTLPGALVEGYSAFVVDVMFTRNLERYLPHMTPAQRGEIMATRRAVREAAALWHGQPADGSVTQLPQRTPADDSVWVTVADAALVIGTSERRVRQLAAQWQWEDRARKVRGSWLVDEEALQMHIEARKSRIGA